MAVVVTDRTARLRASFVRAEPHAADYQDERLSVADEDCANDIDDDHRGTVLESNAAALGGAAALPSHAYAGGGRAPVQIVPDFESVSPKILSPQPLPKRQNLTASPAASQQEQLTQPHKRCVVM